MKIGKNSLIGLLSLFVFFLFAALSVRGNPVRCVVFVVIYLVLFVLMFKLLDRFLGRIVTKSKDFWLMLAPFALMLIFSRLIFGWDILFAFSTAGFISVAVDCVSRLIQKKAGIKAVLCVSAAVFASVAVFTVAAVIGGSII